MRIGILCHASFGGSVRIATELAVELARQSHDVHLFAQSILFGRWDDGDRNGIKLHCLTSIARPFDPHAGLHIDWTDREFDEMTDLILHVIESEGLDIIHFHYAIPFAYIAAEIQSRLGQRSPLFVGTLHGTDVSLNAEHSLHGVSLKDVLRQMDCLTTVSHSHAKLACQKLNLPQKPLVIHNFVDLARFHPHPGISHKKKSRPVIVHVSNFRSVKRTPLLAHLYARLAAQIDAVLWLVGDGPDLQQVKQILSTHGIERDVHFWGLQEDTAAIFQQVHLLLMTSITESFCVVALEAMASGVPVLSSNVGGVPEVVLDGKTGLLFDAHDMDGALDSAVRLLTDAARLHQMGQAAARHANQFGRTEISREYIVLYRKLMNQPQPRHFLEMHF